MGVILSVVSEPIASVIVNIYNWVYIVFHIVMGVVMILMIVDKIYDNPTRAKKIAKEIAICAIKFLVFAIPVTIDIISCIIIYIIDNRVKVLYVLAITVVSIIMIPIDMVVGIYTLAFDRDE